MKVKHNETPNTDEIYLVYFPIFLVDFSPEMPCVPYSSGPSYFPWESSLAWPALLEQKHIFWMASLTSFGQKYGFFNVRTSRQQKREFRLYSSIDWLGRRRRWGRMKDYNTIRLCHCSLGFMTHSLPSLLFLKIEVWHSLVKKISSLIKTLFLNSSKYCNNSHLQW